QLRAQIAKTVAKTTAKKAPSANVWGWRIIFVPAVIMLIFALALNFYLGRERAARQRVYSELADLHVATLASATPADVISPDKHTVTPWFQGKIPFTFNLPDLPGSEFSLIGGRVTYFWQKR